MPRTFVDRLALGSATDSDRERDYSYMTTTPHWRANRNEDLFDKRCHALRNIDPDCRWAVPAVLPDLVSVLLSSRGHSSFRALNLSPAS